MTIALDGSGGIFTRIGKSGHALNLLNEFRGATGSIIATDLPTEVEDAMQEVDGDTMIIRGCYEQIPSALASCLAGMGSLGNQLKSSSQSLLIEMADADNPLHERNVTYAAAELIKQMIANTETVQINAVTGTVTAGGSNVGTGKVLVSLLDGSGKTLEYAFAETIDITVTNNLTAGSESLAFMGEAAETDKLSWKWPAGSGCATSLTSVSSAGGLSLLTNGGFETFTVSNTPDDWTLVAGSAGTEILSEASVIYVGTKALKIAGAATNTQIKQAITGLSSRTPYAVNFWCKCSGSPAAGVLTVDLHDGSSVINDETGTANSFTVTLTSLGTTYVAKNAFFRLPEPVPAAVYLRFRLSTALSAGTNLYIDEATFVAATQLYTAGPYVAAFSGAVGWSTDDTLSLAVTNDYAGDLQMLAEKLWDLSSKGLILPSGGSPTVADSLIG